MKIIANQNLKENLLKRRQEDKNKYNLRKKKTDLV